VNYVLNLRPQTGERVHLVPRQVRRQFSKVAPNRSWSSFSTASPIAIPAATKVVIATLALNNPGIDETILRSVGVLNVVSDQVAAGEEQIGALGMIMVNDRAVTAGAASIPGPITDGTDDGWLLYVPFAQSFTFVTAAGFDSRGGTQFAFDSKAKRRLEEGKTFVIMVENAHATHGFFVSMVFRTLSVVSGT